MGCVVSMSIDEALTRHFGHSSINTASERWALPLKMLFEELVDVTSQTPTLTGGAGIS